MEEGNSSSSPSTSSSSSFSFQSPLEYLESKGSQNILKTVLHRELWGCYPQGSTLGKIPLETFDSFLLRQLLVARNTEIMMTGGIDNSEKTVSHKRKRTRSEAFPMNTLPAIRFPHPNRGAGGPSHVVWLIGKLFVYVRDGYTCYNCENGVLKKKYHILSARKWKAWDIWDLPDHPIPCFKKPIGPLLCTLSANTVNLYFVDTGKRYYDEIKLDRGKAKFREILPSEEMGKLIIPCIKAALSPDIHYDAVLLDVYHPLKSLRLQISKLTTGRRHPSQVACYDNLLQFDFRDCVQIWDLIEVMKTGSSSERDITLQNLDDGIPVSHIISQLRAPIMVFHAKKIDEFSLGLYPLPLQFINQGSVYDIRTQGLVPVKSNQPSTLSELQYQTVLHQEEDGNMDFHQDGSSRIIFLFKNILCGASIRTTEMDGHPQGSELVQDVYMKFDIQPPSVSVPIHVQRRSSRVPATRVKYTEEDDSCVRIKYMLASHIDAIVIMEVTSESPNFQFHFYDSKSWKKILAIVPEFEVERTIPSEELSTFTFNVTEAEIIVGNVGKNQEKSFVISLLDESGVDKDSSSKKPLISSSK